MAGEGVGGDVPAGQPQGFVGRAGLWSGLAAASRPGVFAVEGVPKRAE